MNTPVEALDKVLIEMDVASWDARNDPADTLNDDASQIIARLRKRGFDVVSGWQPIETAPKDGTHILLFCPNDEPQIVVGYWLHDGSEIWDGWAFADEALSDIEPDGPNPTHWKEKPDTPDVSVGAET